MLIRNWLVFVAATILTMGMTVAMAGGPDMAPASMSHSGSHSGFYIEGQSGYVRSNYKDLVGNTVTTSSGAVLNVTSKSLTNGKGAFAFGGALGYQWNAHLAAELGYYYLGKASAHVNLVSVSPVAGVTVNDRENVRRYAIYAAAKLIAPIKNSFSLFFKGGLAYVNKRAGGSNVITFGARQHIVQGNANADFIRPLLGVGAQYYFNHHFYAIAQYVHIAGVGSHILVPSDLLTVGLGGQFAV